MLQCAKTIAKLQDELGFINDVRVALARLQGWIEEGEISVETRDCVATWHTQQVEETLKRALPHAEFVLGSCLPWCGECERRGLSTIRHGQRALPLGPANLGVQNGPG